MKLGQQSQKLHDLITNIRKGSPNQFKKSLPLSGTSRLFLQKMLERFRTAYNRFRYTLLTKKTYPWENVERADLFTDIPKEIRDIIVSSPKITQSYEFVVGSRTVRVHMFLPLPFKTPTDRINKKTQQYFLHSVRLIWLWFHTVSENIQGNCGESLDIYLYLTQHYKRKPQQGPIDVIHANTAYTRTCTKNGTIQIFREEEWFKVLIHETFHNLGLDFSGMSEVTTVYGKTIQEMFHVQTDGLLFETYCETWATIINTMFVTSLSNGFPRTQHNINFIIEKMENILSLESKYSLFQSGKVIHHMGISYSDFIHPDTPESRAKLQKYQERTNVLCYYVLKSVFLYHLDTFLQWCWTHNHGSLNFTKTKSNLKSFYALIYRLYRKESYVKEHMYMEEHVKNTKNGFEHETLRMTIYG